MQNRSIILLILALLSLVSVGFCGLPSYTPDRLSFRIRTAVNELQLTEDGRVALPTGLVTFDQFCNKHGITRVEPLVPRDPITLSNNAYYETGLSRDYRLWLSKPQYDDAILEALGEELSLCEEMEFAFPIPFRELYFTPNDWALSGRNSWGLDSAHCRQAWDSQRGSGSVLVASIDTGIRYTHPDLAANVYANPLEDLNHDGILTAADSNGIDDDGNGFVDDVIGYDFVSYMWEPGLPVSQAVGEEYGPRDNSPDDVFGHGTQVGGLLAGVTNNGIGIASGSFNVRAIALKAFFAYYYGSLQSLGSDDDIIAATLYAVNRGVRILNYSFGGSINNPQFQSAVTYARTNNCLIFAAAGNNANQSYVYPAAYTSVVSVAALGTGNVRWPNTTYGAWIDVCAPGASIYSTAANNTYHAVDYISSSGTSMASPIAASVAALALSKNPNLSADSLESIIKTNTRNVNSFNTTTYQNKLGTGEVDAALVMAAISSANISISYPNGADQVALGRLTTLRWSAAIGISNYVIEVDRNYPSGNWESIYTGAASAQSYNWTPTGAASANCRLRILNGDNLAQGDTSASNFTLYIVPSVSAYPTSLSQTLRTSDTLRANFSLTNAGSGTLTANLIDTSANYTVLTSNDPGGPVYSWVDASSGSAGVSGDDITAGPYTLPFTFDYFGRKYSQVWMCSNGWLAFTGTGFAGYQNFAFPQALQPAMIAVYWDDLLVGSNAISRVWMDAPNNRAIFQWDNVQYSGGTGTLSFEAILYGDGRVVLQYRTLSGGTPSSSVGMQDATLTKVIQVFHNQTVPTSFAVAFTPTSRFWTPSASSISINGNETGNFSLLWNTTGRAAGTTISGALLVDGNQSNTPFYLPLSLTVIARTPPAIPQSPTIGVVGGNTTLRWNGVHTDSAGYALTVPVTYRVESNDAFSITGWSTVTTQSDTVVVTPSVGVQSRYYRITAITE